MLELTRCAFARALIGSLLLTACGHGGGAAKPDEKPAPAQRPKAASEQARAADAGASEERIEDFMVDHFVIVTFGRDAVINGDLEALREPLAAFADYDYRSVAPGGWLPWIAQIQTAARLTSEASALETAAVGVATMARSCGGCHEASGRGPDFGPSDHETKTPSSDTLEERMQRHIWAADRMWEGLTAPSDEAWQEGAAALAHTPSSVPATKPPLPPRFVEELLATRALADDAVGATSAAQRADVYAGFIASCANCHAHGVDL
jgi:hypothetical protein